MIKRIVLLILLSGYSVICHAQFSDSVNYYIKYASTGSINRTNDGNSYLLNNNMRFRISKKKISLNAAAGYIYGKNNQALTNDDISAAVDFSVFRSKDYFYYWGLANFDKSFSLKINRRFQGGVGVAYDIIHRPNATLNISDGVLFENSDLFLKDTIPDVYHTFRNSLRILYRWVIKDIVVLEGTHFLQNSLSHGNDFIIKSNTSLSVKLRSWLSITAALNYNKLNRTDRENLLINYGVAIEKYF
ncbi:DUF481 domain-containing protein [Chitinophaga pendula]|uniref:DUF481 domain-containing protein n=1 Tax=Chitinophaga TaxID=79328 RepID=UPI000BAF71CA|nr:MULTISPECIES: DUF481 domain-containing protein [Chitinophaga]ASZ12728.1 hypothetical protein CK934_18080 [Chitinophaga sp. MD30]UCJ09656.1 DUF481 domain-containing protein [Chitinophaga pendula]